jgi:hypothetical protein
VALIRIGTLRHGDGWSAVERRFIELDRVATGISEGPRGRVLGLLTAKLVLAGSQVLKELDRMDPVTLAGNTNAWSRAEKSVSSKSQRLTGLNVVRAGKDGSVSRGGICNEWDRTNRLKSV